MHRHDQEDRESDSHLSLIWLDWHSPISGKYNRDPSTKKAPSIQ